MHLLQAGADWWAALGSWIDWTAVGAVSTFVAAAVALWTAGESRRAIESQRRFEAQKAETARAHTADRLARVIDNEFAQLDSHLCQAVGDAKGERGHRMPKEVATALAERYARASLQLTLRFVDQLGAFDGETAAQIMAVITRFNVGSTSGPPLVPPVRDLTIKMAFLDEYIGRFEDDIRQIATARTRLKRFFLKGAADGSVEK